MIYNLSVKILKFVVNSMLEGIKKLFKNRYIPSTFTNKNSNGKNPEISYCWQGVQDFMVLIWLGSCVIVTKPLTTPLPTVMTSFRRTPKHFQVLRVLPVQVVGMGYKAIWHPLTVLQARDRRRLCSSP